MEELIPTSHGVVMDAPQFSNWMGPNLAAYPNSNATPLQTGGGT